MCRSGFWQVASALSGLKGRARFGFSEAVRGLLERAKLPHHNTILRTLLQGVPGTSHSRVPLLAASSATTNCNGNLRGPRLMSNYATKFEQGLKYNDFLARHGTDEHRRRWAGVYDAVRLTPAQRELLG